MASATAAGPVQEYTYSRPSGLGGGVLGLSTSMESFSACCGVYARLDVLEPALDGEVHERGTTNVDVNGPLREALARVGGGDPLHLAVDARSWPSPRWTGPWWRRRCRCPSAGCAGSEEAAR